MREHNTSKMISASHMVSNMEMNINADLQRALVHERLAQKVAHSIVDKKVVEEKMDYYTTFRMELFVLTPDELHHLIQDEVMRMARFMNLSTMCENINKDKV